MTSPGPTRRTVGVIGGMGPLATAKFFERLTNATPARHDQDHLHVIVDSDPAIPDRSAYLLGRGPDPGPALVRTARRLEAAGCDLLVMPCNTAHAFADAITSSVSIPLVYWIETAATEAAARAEVVGLLATDGMVRSGLYQVALEARGVRVLAPDGESQAVVMAAVYGVKGGTLESAARAALFRVAVELRERGADLLVLGCTEIPLAAAADHPGWPLPLLDPADAVVRRVMDLAGTVAVATLAGRVSPGTRGGGRRPPRHPAG